MESLGLFLYYATRLRARIAQKFWRWVLGSFLKRNARSCGSIRVNGYGQFSNVSGLTIGNNVHVNYGANWVCDGGLTIADHVHISSNCTIYTRNHNSRGTALPYDDTNIARPVTIGRNVWIGTNVTILPGARIGEGAIIGAGAVVHGEVADFAIIGAAAPVEIGQRDREHYAELARQGRYGGASGKLVVGKVDRT